MGKGRPLKAGKEYTREKELSYKNKELQREVARLKREIERLQRDHWNFIDEDKEPEGIDKVQLKKDRVCFSCGKGRLRLVKFAKFNGEELYFRSCDTCDYRTRNKKFTEEVEE